MTAAGRISDREWAIMRAMDTADEMFCEGMEIGRDFPRGKGPDTHNLRTAFADHRRSRALLERQIRDMQKAGK